MTNYAEYVPPYAFPRFRRPHTKPCKWQIRLFDLRDFYSGRTLGDLAVDFRETAAWCL